LIGRRHAVFLSSASGGREARPLIDKLTPRVFEVFRFVIMGLLNKQIAAELHTAEKTIKVHRGRVMQKLRVTSVADPVRVSQRAGVSRGAQASIRLRSIRLRSNTLLNGRD